MSAANHLTELSISISENTKIITEYLSSKGLEATSFSVDGLRELPLDPKDQEVQLARSKLMSATQDLHVLTTGPKETLRLLMFSSIDYFCLQAISYFKIAQAVPITEPISFTALSAATTVPMKHLTRILRNAMTLHIFAEPTPNYVAHTSLSRLIAEDQVVQATVGLFTEDCWLPVARSVDAMVKWPGSEEPNEGCFQLAYNMNESVFSYFAKDMMKLKRYGMAMSSSTDTEGYQLDFLVAGFDWASLGEATVVDLGGCEGYVSFALAKAFPSLRFIVQDLPNMRAPSLIHPIPEGLESRVELTVHSYFDPQPVTADVYFYRQCFHNNSDKYAIQMLQALIPALKPGAKILINDVMLPEPGVLRPEDEKNVRVMDIMMSVTFNARERALQDWKDLFTLADKRFSFVGAKQLAGKLWIMEAEWNA